MTDFRKLNRFERWLMNNPARSACQRFVEVPLLTRWAKGLGGRVLEVGCGRGVGSELLLEQLVARKVDAFDPDAEMVALARRRLARFGDRVELWTGVATEIPRPDRTYDVIFDFGVLHHVVRWRDALAEIHRLLRPGGRLIGEEMLARFIVHPLSARLFDHPSEDRFDFRTLRRSLEDAGFELLAGGEFADLVGWFVAQRPVDGADESREAPPRSSADG
jgi:ubiquinone/menaquinone biosynthesis C-methylase UbiE